ncbi:hypothetical protein EB796_005995 [Bugula neritina]|uniref:EGF-like domain-containing protein n=1 Tax=Bugula neritina TaxID=10212 RepID=A0A7J7KAL2_BUGNE|nr:hypothetical protein EB796_005995 [Bugula neritina]
MTSEQSFIRQISNVTDFPAVYDINECSVDELNSCSPNALCTNTDGSYFCTCSEEYSSDLSPHNTSAGRVCAVACEPNYCSPSHFCEERPETSPHCICIGVSKSYNISNIHVIVAKDIYKLNGIVCPLWILILSVVAFSLILSIILAVICVSKRRTQHILLQQE